MKVTFNLPDNAHAAVHFDSPESLVIEVTLEPVQPPADPPDDGGGDHEAEVIAGLLAQIGYTARTNMAAPDAFVANMIPAVHANPQPGSIADLRSIFYVAWCGYSGSDETPDAFAASPTSPTDAECFNLLVILALHGGLA